MVRLLLVDDDELLLRGLKRLLLRKRKWEIVAFSNPEDALKELKQTAFNVIISDYEMSPINGVTFLHESRVFQPNAVRIVLSGQSNFDGIVDAVNEAEIYRYLVKPVNMSDILFAIERGLFYQRVAQDRDDLGIRVRELEEQLKLSQQALEKMVSSRPELEHYIPSTLKSTNK